MFVMTRYRFGRGHEQPSTPSVVWSGLALLFSTLILIFFDRMDGTAMLADMDDALRAVSYTHLTLPTKA